MLLQLYGLMDIEAAFIHTKDLCQNKFQKHEIDLID